MRVLADIAASVSGLSADAQEARALLVHLQRFMNESFGGLASERTTLGRELDFALAYLSVCQARMGRRLRIFVEARKDLLHLDFPPLSLATLVENAVTHSLSPAPATGTIRLSAQQSGDVLRVRVADDGVGFRTGLGDGRLADLRTKLRLLHGSAGRLQLESNKPRGVQATLIVPARAER